MKEENLAIICPHCGAYTRLVHLEKKDPEINQHGRLELKFLADYEEAVAYDSEKKLYHCLKCGGSCTLQEVTK